MATTFTVTLLNNATWEEFEINNVWELYYDLGSNSYWITTNINGTIEETRYSHSNWTIKHIG